VKEWEEAGVKKRERKKKANNGNINDTNDERESTYPIFGPPSVRSKTCLGFNSHWNFWSNFAPWLPPDLGLMKTITGDTFAVGIGLITKARWSFSLCNRYIKWLTINDNYQLHLIRWAVKTDYWILKHSHGNTRLESWVWRNFEILNSLHLIFYLCTQQYAEAHSAHVIDIQRIGK